MVCTECFNSLMKINIRILKVGDETNVQSLLEILFCVIELIDQIKMLEDNKPIQNKIREFV